MKIFEADRVFAVRREGRTAKLEIRFDTTERERGRVEITKKIDRRSRSLFGIYDEPRYDEAD